MRTLSTGSWICDFYPRPPGGGRPELSEAEATTPTNFYPRPPGGGRPSFFNGFPHVPVFLSTPSGWRATSGRPVQSNMDAISIHALRVEGDRSPLDLRKFCSYFYPRPPGGGRQNKCDGHQNKSRFLSTPSGWRATAQTFHRGSFAKISIHALRVEGDLKSQYYGLFKLGISIHALRVEGDTVRAGTMAVYNISIHALRVEGDCRSSSTQKIKIQFLSTPSGWRATDVREFFAQLRSIFLSTPSGWRATILLFLNARLHKDFYPRPPGGGRPRRLRKKNSLSVFLSTPSGWRATSRLPMHSRRLKISIHALRVEGDHPSGGHCSPKNYFYPRPPGGGRRRVK